MRKPVTKNLALARILALGSAAVLVALAAGCDRGEPQARTAVPATAGSQQGPARDPVPQGPVTLEDVSEAQPDYVIGISYPPEAGLPPVLTAAMKDYAEAARADLMEAVQGRRALDEEGEGSATMYDLSLAYSRVLVSPTVVAYAADGSTYTGGAHSMPLVARFVWLPQQERMLTAERLVPVPEGWEQIAGYVRARLHEALPDRIEATGLEGQERQQLLRTSAGMIDEGTDPDPANFDQFEPVAGEGGQLAGLRFVFAPYQVAPYSEGVQQVEVPAPVLLPVVAPELRPLFEGGPASDTAPQPDVVAGAG